MPALEAALSELGSSGARYEVFARNGASTLIRRDGEEAWEQRENREVGVGCRVSSGGASGFAAASGHAAVAGREAARAALAAAVPSDDPIPPGARLGCSPYPEPAPTREPEELFVIARRLVELIDRAPGQLRLADLRLLHGEAESYLINGDGFSGRARTSGSSLEMLLAPREGPWRLIRRAEADLGAWDLQMLAEQAREAALLAVKGEPPGRRLTDVLLAPAAAAPLVEAIGRALFTHSISSTTPRVSTSWRLVDERAGPRGLLGLPFDGEGFPARAIPLLNDGCIGERAVVWGEARAGAGKAGGANRPSYRRPPETAPANLVVHRTNQMSARDLIAALSEGVFVVLPAGPVHVDRHEGRFRMLAAGVTIRRGRPAGAHPLLEVRGSLKGLLRGLAATGNDEQSFSLNCAVTTPSLLFRKLEVA